MLAWEPDDGCRCRRRNCGRRWVAALGIPASTPFALGTRGTKALTVKPRQYLGLN